MKKITLLFAVLAVGTMAHSKSWVHGQLEYMYSLPQNETKYNSGVIDTVKGGIEMEVYHSFQYLPNIKFDMKKTNAFKQNNKTLYYSSYFDGFHIDFGGTISDVEFLSKDYKFNYLMGRVKSKIIRNVIGSFTYNYELDGKVNEYLVDLNYIMTEKLPITLGFQYKSSVMKLMEDYKVEGIFLKVGFKF